MLNEHQIDIYEAIVGTLLIVSFMPSIIDLFSALGMNLSLIGRISIYDVLIRYIATGLLIYLFYHTDKPLYLIMPAIWLLWVGSTVFIALPPVMYAIMGIVCFGLGFIYLMKVVD